MKPATARTNNRLIVAMTGFIAFASIAVAGLMALRLVRARQALDVELARCACCDDLDPDRTR